MCGINGIVSLSKDSKPNIEDIKRMNNTISHRGPDQSGIYNDGQVLLGHQRLSIIDLSENGKQPMSDKDGKVWIVFNGEIYNYLELKKDLEMKYEFKSTSDTEVLIYGYMEWGIDKLLSKLNGMFAFAIFDSTTNYLFAVRDMLGIKPLYYTFNNDYFVFSSELKGILSLDFIERSISKEAFSHYLSFLSTPAPLTIIEGVRKLECGTYLSINLKNKATGIKRYFDLDGIKINHSISENEALYNIENMLVNSVKTQRISDVPLGVFLSGGLDSSLLVALNSKFSEKPVKTFSVVFEDKALDESKYSELVAEQYNTDHKTFYLDDKKIYNSLDIIGKYQDEPIGDPVNIPLYYVSKLARDNEVKVVHVGEGSDEQFCGYNEYEIYKTYFNIGLNKIPLNRFLFYANNFYNRFKFYGKSNISPRNIMGFYDNQKEFVSTKYDYTSVLGSLANHINKSNIDDYFINMRVIEYKLRLPELLNMRVDKFTMANSIEARVPFMDDQMVKYSLSIPVSLHMNNNVPKYLLKKIARKYLFKDLIYRKKMGFGLPYKNFFDSNVETISEIIRDVGDLNGLTTNNLDQIFNKYRSNFRGWVLFNFALWYKNLQNM